MRVYIFNSVKYTAEPTPLCTIMKNEFLSKAESDKQKTAALATQRDFPAVLKNR